MGENITKLIKPADIITLINALLGFAAIIQIIRGEFTGALVLILAAVIADGADGAVARYTGYGMLGGNLDSLADVIAFGAAPAVAAYVYLGGGVSGLFACLFLVCGMLRLARFNVAGKKDGFEGIPITSGGFIVALFLLVKDLVKDFVPYVEYSFIFLLVIISLLMVSTIGYPKLKSPVVLAPMGLLLVLDIAVFFLGRQDMVKIASLILLVFVCAYILSPLGRRFYDKR